jgi:hypothetical protein
MLMAGGFWLLIWLSPNIRVVLVIWSTREAFHRKHAFQTTNFACETPSRTSTSIKRMMHAFRKDVVRIYYCIVIFGYEVHISMSGLPCPKLDVSE